MRKDAGVLLAAAWVVAFLFVACTAEQEGPSMGKPVGGEGKADAVDRLCADAGQPAGCDICVHRDWYGDGECDDFCSSPDPDCEPEAGECSWDIPSTVGESSEELVEQTVGSLTYSSDDIGEIPVIDARQIFEAVRALGFGVEDEDFDVVFDVADEETIDLHEVEVANERYDWVSFYAGDTEVGAVFRQNTVEMVAQVSDGDLMGCAPAEPEPEPTEVTCHWDTPSPVGDDSEALEELADNERTITMDDMDSLSELESRQIFEAALHLEFLVGDEDFDVVFEVADEGEYFLSDVVVDGASFDWVTLYAGDTEVGVIFAADTTRIVAEVGDGDIMGCN